VNLLPRRDLLQRALKMTAAALLLPRIVDLARAADSCIDPASESLRSSLHYASATPKAAEPCSACGFYSANAGKPACGNCQIMSGPVDEKGHCDSWAARS
jgi:hypothetical protein